MKICPVCNDSFADQLNFCDIDGARLTREGSAQERNKWWSLLGAGLLVGALVISAASIFFLPKARVSTPIVNSEAPPLFAPAKPASAETATSVAAAASPSSEAESVSTVAVVPEVKKKDKALANANDSGAMPNPKAAAVAAEEADKKSPAGDAAPATTKKPEPVPPVKSVSDTRAADAAAKPQPPPDLKKDTKTPSTTAKSSDKDSNDKKKNEEKDKKKGGFLNAFKKIFGKG